MSIKINKLEIENVKRVKAVKLEPTANGLTVIGGRNAQGKTSVLDSIAWALGGNEFKPSNAVRDESALPPNLHVVLSNGLVVERKGKNSTLSVTDPTGQKSGQKLLDSFVEKLALDLPRFMNSSNKEKAKIMLNIIGMGDRLFELERQEKELYDERTAIGRIADQKKKHAKEMEYFPDAPKELVSASELIKQQQEILARNGENQKKRDRLGALKSELNVVNSRIRELQEQMHSLTNMLHDLDNKRQALESDIKIGETDVLDLMDQSTEELEKSISNIDDINRRVRANLDKDKAEEDAQDYGRQYDSLTLKIEDIRKQKNDLLQSADLPLEQLSVENGELTYKGKSWDCMSGAEQLKVATSIIRRLNPECGFILMDRLEQMDTDTMKEFGEWIEKEGLQVIATRVSTGDECSIIIEDGYGESVTEKKEDTPENYPSGNSEPEPKTWKAGEF